MKRLLFSLLKVIASSQDIMHSSEACRFLLYYLRKIPFIFESFEPNGELLAQLNFEKIINSPELASLSKSGSNASHASLKEARKEALTHIYDLMVFINRYYPGITLDDYALSEYNLKKLRKEESMRIWHAFDHLITRMDSLNKKSKTRGDLTANAIQEIFNYMDSLKKTL